VERTLSWAIEADKEQASEMAVGPSLRETVQSRRLQFNGSASAQENWQLDLSLISTGLSPVTNPRATVLPLGIHPRLVSRGRQGADAPIRKRHANFSTHVLEVLGTLSALLPQRLEGKVNGGPAIHEKYCSSPM
jgi:hypothetical protein